MVGRSIGALHIERRHVGVVDSHVVSDQRIVLDFEHGELLLRAIFLRDDDRLAGFHVGRERLIAVGQRHARERRAAGG